MTLTAHAVVTHRGLDARIDVAAGTTLALLGPNGAGKSSLLASLAGTLRPDAGRAALDSAELYDADAPRPFWLPAHRRPVGLLGQRSPLFPHLSVLDNVAFADRARGATRSEARRNAGRWLSAVDAAGLAAARAYALSGGQSQRVAIARALAAEPAAMLLDEPCGGLDVTASAGIRALLADVLRDRTAVIATHDLIDVVTLANTVAILDHGTVVEHGEVATVLGRPQHRFTARMAGIGRASGTRTRDGIDLGDGNVVAGSCDDRTALGARALIAVKPKAVSLHDAGGAPPHLNAVTGAIDWCEVRGDYLRVSVRGLLADVELSELTSLPVTPGALASVAFAPADAVIYADRRP